MLQHIQFEQTNKTIYLINSKFNQIETTINQGGQRDGSGTRIAIVVMEVEMVVSPYVRSNGGWVGSCLIFVIVEGVSAGSVHSNHVRDNGFVAVTSLGKEDAVREGVNDSEGVVDGRLDIGLEVEGQSG